MQSVEHLCSIYTISTDTVLAELLVKMAANSIATEVQVSPLVTSLN